MSWRWLCSELWSEDVIQRLYNSCLIWFYSDLHLAEGPHVFFFLFFFSERFSSVLVVNDLTVRWPVWRMWEDNLASVHWTRLRGRQQVIFHKYLVRFLVFVRWQLLTQQCLVARSYFNTWDKIAVSGLRRWFIMETIIWRESLEIKLSCMWWSYSLYREKHDMALRWKLNSFSSL